MDTRAIAAEYGQWLAECYQWHYFGTLTLNPEWSGVGSQILTGQCHRFFWKLFHECAVDAGLATRHGQGYRGTLANSYRKKRGRFVYVFAIEPQRRGALHAHFLLYMPKYFESIDYKAVNRSWKYGLNDIQVPRVQNQVTDYVSKYVLKRGDIYFSESFESHRLAGVHHHAAVSR